MFLRPSLTCWQSSISNRSTLSDLGSECPDLLYLPRDNLPLSTDAALSSAEPPPPTARRATGAIQLWGKTVGSPAAPLSPRLDLREKKTDVKTQFLLDFVSNFNPIESSILAECL